MSIACLLSLSTAVHDGRKTAISLNGLPSQWTYTPATEPGADSSGSRRPSLSFSLIHCRPSLFAADRPCCIRAGGGR